MNNSYILGQLDILLEQLVSSDDLQPTSWKPPGSYNTDDKTMNYHQPSIEIPLSKTPTEYFENRGGQWCEIIKTTTSNWQIRLYSGGKWTPKSKGPKLYKATNMVELLDILLNHNLTYTDISFINDSDRKTYIKEYDKAIIIAKENEKNSVEKLKNDFYQD